MAQITLNIPDAALPRVLDAMAAQFGRPATVPDPANPEGPPIANPQTKAQFAKAKLLAFLMNTVRNFEAGAAGEAARQAAAARADTEITLS